MLHGPDRATVETHRAGVADILGAACARHDIL
jgi:hypothetical protein